MKNKINNIIKIVFVIYLMALVLVIMLKFPTSMVSDALAKVLNGEELVRSKPQLVPFKTIIEYTMNVHSLTDWFIKNLVCNIIMFVPWGIMVSHFRRQKKDRYIIFALVTGMLLIVGIELTQYITCLGLFDVDDIILNVIGVIIGIIIYNFITKIHFSKKVKSI